ncbi:MULTISPECIES: hypothetical protein [unclassified Nostoc]|uniref:hypothetical protein n=1 Tax=unclassified Nostoc TaxID=2593658 RepID=UPI002AD49258|nr:hypothetical protein [Nostoc sp. DedQUE03]MDZ8043672.1 hypothetical protein [Nostoc sp. DedQUE02]
MFIAKQFEEVVKKVAIATQLQIHLTVAKLRVKIFITLPGSEAGKSGLHSRICAKLIL